MKPTLFMLHTDLTEQDLVVHSPNDVVLIRDNSNPLRDKPSGIPERPVRFRGSHLLMGIRLRPKPNWAISTSSMYSSTHHLHHHHAQEGWLEV